jgi:carboxyl-terminal processing protease
LSHPPPRRPPSSPGLLVLLLVPAALLVSARPAPAQTPYLDDCRSRALAAEKRGDWAEACRYYDEVLRKDRTQADARDGYQRCLRRFHLATRHRDPNFRETVARLTPSDALDVYEHVLTVIPAVYVDRQRTDLATLFQSGLQELRFSLEDETFLRDYLPGASPEAVAAFRDRLDGWRYDRVRTLRDAREQAQAVARAARDCGLPYQPLLVTVVALEFSSGACNALDEYSLFLTPGHLAEAESAFRGRLVGVGLELAFVEQRVEVHRVYPRGPAEEAGLQPRDRILRIDRLPVESLPPDYLAERLRGEPGSVVELEVQSPGQAEPRVLRLVRRHSQATTVEYRVLGDANDPEPVGYLRIYSFQSSTYQEVKEALAQLQTQSVKGIIIDLRGNPGGLVTETLRVCELFLPAGVAAYSVSPLGEYNGELPLKSVNPVTLPLAVLVDGDTASAAELMAGALKESGRARLLGQTTFGKASIQALVPLNKAALAKMPGGVRLTVARFYSPRKQPYSGRGITPDDVLDAEGDLCVFAARQHLLAVARMMMPMR